MEVFDSCEHTMHPGELSRPLESNVETTSRTVAGDGKRPLPGGTLEDGSNVHINVLFFHGRR